MITKNYVSKGTAKRNAAEQKIKLITENLILCNTLKEIREDRKKSQVQIADAMHIDNSVVNKLKKNFEKAKLTAIIRYVKALKAKSVNIVFEFDKKDSRVLHLNT